MGADRFFVQTTPLTTHLTQGSQTGPFVFVTWFPLYG
jgi:hypothetical protein